MRFVTEDHNNALDIVKSNPELGVLWKEITDSLRDITDERLRLQIPKSSNKMSLSAAINDLIDEELKKKHWVAQSAIFQGEKYKDKRWRLDFSKRIETPHKGITGMAVEVAFNHGEAIAWNLMKPVLAAEINHIGLQTDRTPHWRCRRLWVRIPPGSFTSEKVPLTPRSLFCLWGGDFVRATN